MYKDRLLLDNDARRGRYLLFLPADMLVQGGPGGLPPIDGGWWLRYIHKQDFQVFTKKGWW